ncbi:MAG: type II toxin-antitoxin system antitoxin SocA domain-containing protein [Candidatus Paceibacterota bacterium]|jgi:uncharacterized phage-associated protein
MTTAAKITDYLIDKSLKEGNPVTNKRLQKLLYYIQAWHLAINKEPLFNDKIEAWIHGPAIRSVYETYKSYIAKPIDKVHNPNIAQELGIGTTRFIDRIVNAYSKYDTATLEYMTHAEDPWQKARKGLEINESSNNEITQESMRDYYSERLVNSK